ncbi:uncharacterized protein LOC126859522 [Cataglyphis hispanica]|uniref:uncharacterized protein LOC126859522 n=1 Tax=Cataglyphis hispanica TaxID=1086592 RepID=UPI00217FA54D|nr:uncharacterized protein LOC126859522 [Cataglyphis hispanica]
MQKSMNLKSAKAMQNFGEGKLSKIPRSNSKVKGNEQDSVKAIKTLAGARQEEMKKVKKELKEMLPILKPSEVKRFHLPLHEAIIHELEENGYEESIRYLKELFELDEETRKETGPGTLTWKKPRLKDNKDALKCLKEGLIACEQAKNAGDLVFIIMKFLNMALFFQAMTWEWWWVAERLYRSALENTTLIETNEQQTITLIHYLYGRFLCEQIQNTTESLYHLQIAREASEVKHWNASKVTGRKEETIFRECNVFMYKTLLMHAQQIDPNQLDIIVKVLTEALARATDSDHYEYMANALYELGKNQLRSGDVKLAFHNFSKFLAIVKKIPDPEGICNAHMALALAYKLYNSHLQELNDEVNTEKHLHLFREYAQEFKLIKKLAQAHFCTGEHFLSKRRPDIATSHLKKSFNLYNELGLYDDANKARIIAGVSKGQGIIALYIDLILQCGVANTRAISTLCQWKNRRSIFWTEKILHTDSEESFTFEEAITSLLSVLTNTALEKNMTDAI